MKKILKIVLYSFLSLQIVVPFILPFSLLSYSQTERAEDGGSNGLSEADRKELRELLRNMKSLESPLEIRNTLIVNGLEIGFDFIVFVIISLHILLFMNGIVFIILLVHEIIILRRAP